MRIVLIVVFTLFVPSLALAFPGLLLLPGGAPAAGFEVSVIGLPLTAVTDADGRFTITPDPAVPFRLVATGPSGEASPVLEIAALPEDGPLEVALPASFLDTVTVTSGVAPGIDAPPAAALVRIGQQDLEQRRPQRLAEVLEGIPGASSSGEGPTAVPSIRGLTRGRTLILLDGARVTSERRAGPSAGFLDPFTLAAVEVARGPGSVAYGSDAFGGIINARSRFPEPGGAGPSLRFAVDQGAGAVDERAAGLEASGDLWGGAWLAQLRARSAGDSEAPGGERILASAYSDRGGALRYAVDTPAGRLRAAVTLDESRDTGNPAADSAITRSIYPKESSRRFNLGLVSGPVAGWDSLDLGLFLGTYRLVLDRERVPIATVARQIDRSDVDANDGSVRAVGSRAALGGRLQIGAEVVSRFGLQAITDRDLFDLAGNQTARQTTVSIDDARRVDSGLFLIWDRPLLAATLLSVGLRGDRVESRNQGGFFGDRSTSHDNLSGYLAVTAGLTPRLVGLVGRY